MIKRTMFKNYGTMVSHPDSIPPGPISPIQYDCTQSTRKYKHNKMNLTEKNSLHSSTTSHWT